MPDYMLVFAVPVLTHHVAFTDVTDTAQLQLIRQCLWFILEPLITKNDAYCFGFYKALIEQMKNHKDALKPEDEVTNHVSFLTLFSYLLFYILKACLSKRCDILLN